MSFQCRSVFITGANRGIGLELVKAFLNLSPAPEHVFATARSPESASDLKQLQSNHSNLHVLQLDVTDFDSFPKVVEQVAEILDGKGLNVLLNNAGILERSPIGEVTVDSMVNLYKTNTVAPLMLVQAFLPLLKKAAADTDDKSSLKAWILNMSSSVASVEENGMGGLYSYRASKTALNVINKSLSIDLKPFGIMAIVLHPGWVQTEMGGPRALISTAESVTGLMKVITSLDETKSGMFYNLRGEIVRW
ncbi:uncharacterized protein LOC110252390 [Exaiptasia diaphana]|uniref:Uncharacterized protein n=1 Tax=Exaiptasia diaphana TaxID=2652724 RepID=A0A913YU08_EXADI|nr:uncharacterized protein LOC110252390 [Exaiptasia diaphana]XP_028518985.1 uncharacterized protein LOC110252390 [Exaiptasia diaphana]